MLNKMCTKLYCESVVSKTVLLFFTISVCFLENNDVHKTNFKNSTFFQKKQCQVL